MTENKFDITMHSLVPKHTKLSGTEREQVLKELNVSLRQIPKILQTDAALKSLEPKKDDLIKIIRKSPTAGESIFYRVVM